LLHNSGKTGQPGYNYPSTVGGPSEGVHFNPTAVDVTISFTSDQIRLGMNLITNDTDNTRIELFRDGNSLGSVIFATDLTIRFIGIEDTSGFDMAIIDAFGPNNNRFVLDQLTFESAPASVIPEPTMLAIFGGALFGLGWIRRRRECKVS
jgi:hypothetical protein